MQKFRYLYNCRGKLLKAILIRITKNNTYTFKKNLQDKWINLFPAVDKGYLRCYLSHLCM